ncbi:hypothetical protein [Actinophytocola sp.]|uniref:hypothetical protein n=1 Tax=Actinophytocola sp. TaxID=1872138 RepID=UPI002D807CDF|nr:hypothetical protein [Actinophytocola sp.]HET9143630.1 hypothetical protein [Actinophytocola sp.]
MPVMVVKVMGAHQAPGGWHARSIPRPAGTTGTSVEKRQYYPLEWHASRRFGGAPYAACETGNSAARFHKIVIRPAARGLAMAHYINRRIRRGFLGFSAGLMVAAVVVLPGAAAAQAAPVPGETAPVPGAISVSGQQDSAKICVGHAVEHGDWVNTDPNATGIARIELRDCQPVTVCNGNICSVTHDAGWTMRVFGKCSPTNCDWGWSKSDFRMSSGHIHGFYDQGFAKRHVYAKMSQYRPGQLWVYWRTDFTDPNRPDYDKQEWFRRV